MAFPLYIVLGLAIYLPSTSLAGKHRMDCIIISMLILYDILYITFWGFTFSKYRRFTFFCNLALCTASSDCADNRFCTLAEDTAVCTDCPDSDSTCATCDELGGTAEECEGQCPG